MNHVDCLLTPTVPMTANKFDTNTAILGGTERPLVRAYLDHVLPFNLTGQPAVSIPCGFTRAGLPVGLQLVGKPWREDLILQVAYAHEQETKWHKRVPTVN